MTERSKCKIGRLKPILLILVSILIWAPVQNCENQPINEYIPSPYIAYMVIYCSSFIIIMLIKVVYDFERLLEEFEQQVVGYLKLGIIIYAKICGHSA